MAPRRLGCCVTLSTVMAAILLSSALDRRIDKPALDEGKGEDDREEDERLGASKPKGEISEAGGIHEKNWCQRRLERTAIGRHVDLVEDLERTDGAEHDYEENRRPEQRYRDVPQGSPPERPVDLRDRESTR